jgi:hypothetical protein
MSLYNSGVLFQCLAVKAAKDTSFEPFVGKYEICASIPFTDETVTSCDSSGGNEFLNN